MERTFLYTLLLGSLLMTLTWGCCPRRPETPLSQTREGAALLEQGIDANRARQILDQASPRQVQELNQLMFLANLGMADGNEDNPVRLYRRIERELAEPVAIPYNDVQVVLGDLSRVISALPRGPDGVVVLESREGYEVVSRALSSSEGVLPTTGDCLQRIMGYSHDLAVAFLYQEFLSDHHYHEHNMRSAILRAMSNGGAGPQALPLYAQAIRQESQSTYSDIYRNAVSGARQVLGPRFDDWYWEIRGQSYCRDTR